MDIQKLALGLVREEDGDRRGCVERIKRLLCTVRRIISAWRRALEGLRSLLRNVRDGERVPASEYKENEIHSNDE